jgi:hypothetical protein
MARLKGAGIRVTETDCGIPVARNSTHSCSVTVLPKRKESQIAKFRAAARDLDADDDEKGFNEKLGKIAKAKAAARPPKKKRAK